MAYPLYELEHRWGERVNLDLPVQVAVNSLSGIDGRVKNLSLSGALIEADIDLRIHSLIEISVKLPRSPHRGVVIEAHVTRKQDGDVGVEFCEFAPKAIKDLMRSLSIRLSP
jgi:PilZ domain